MSRLTNPIVSVAAGWRRARALLLLVLVAGVFPGVGLAQTLLPGTTITINAGPGDQIDPHIDGALVSYTSDVDGSQEIHFFDFTTNVDTAIPTAGEAFLSDVSGTRIVFTNVTPAGSQIVVYDTATGTGAPIPSGTQRTFARIGGDTAAFQDHSFSSDPNASELLVFDLAAGTTTRLTADALMDTRPAVSPDGGVVVFLKCQTSDRVCDLYQATRAGTSWTTTRLAGPVTDFSRADTSGQIVVYTSTRGGETDIFYQPVGGGPETRLALPGEQRFPSVAGHLIAFESHTAEGNFDLFVYDVATDTLHRVTQTPVDETLNDITVERGQARLVYSARGAGGNFELLAFTFAVPAGEVPFAAFDVTVELDPDEGEFELKGTFTLGAGSDGIDPLTEAVSLEVGPFSTTIPAGAFTQDKQGRFKFEGSMGPVLLEMVIRPLGGGRFEVKAEGEGAELAGVVNPVPVSLTIGDDHGSADVTAEIE